MERIITLRPLTSGEAITDATHSWHARTDSFYTREAAIAAGVGSDCMLPLVAITDPYQAAQELLLAIAADMERSPERAAYTIAADHLRDRIYHERQLEADRIAAGGG